jgi:hypothetical protein
MSDGIVTPSRFLIISRVNYVLRMKKLSAASSSWTALRNRGFRAIWLAAVISGICASAHGTAATWAVNELSHSTLLLSMMSTFSSLPFFLFTLPAGALADMVDRAKLVRIMHLWLAASAAGLAILGWLHLLNGTLILLFVFLIGAAFAFNAPAFSSLLTDIVSDEELPSASVSLDCSWLLRRGSRNRDFSRPEKPAPRSASRRQTKGIHDLRKSPQILTPNRSRDRVRRAPPSRGETYSLEEGPRVCQDIAESKIKTRPILFP